MKSERQHFREKRRGKSVLSKKNEPGMPEVVQIPGWGLALDVHLGKPSFHLDRRRRATFQQWATARTAYTSY